MSPFARGLNEVERHGSLAGALAHWVGELAAQCTVLEETDDDPDLGTLLTCMELMSLAAVALGGRP